MTQVLGAAAMRGVFTDGLESAIARLTEEPAKLPEADSLVGERRADTIQAAADAGVNDHGQNPVPSPRSRSLGVLFPPHGPLALRQTCRLKH